MNQTVNALKRKKSLVFLMSLVLTVTILLSGCVPGQNAADPQREEPSGSLIVYGALHEYEIARLLNKFSEETGIKTEFIRMSSGELSARIIAEKGNPMADIFLGGPSEIHESLIPEGALRAYKSTALTKIDPMFYHADGYWSGFYVGALGIAVNTARFEADFPGKEMPKTWDDLLNPAFIGEVTVASPAASGTAYNFVCTQIFRLGEDKAWSFLDQLHPNVGNYPSSGAAPARLVAAGEFTFGISFGHDIMRIMAAGHRVALVYPPDTGWEIGAVSIINNGPNPESAEKLVDWMLSRDAQQLHTDLSSRISTHPDVLLPPGAISLQDLDLVDFDAAWAGENRERIIEEWSKRYN